MKLKTLIAATALVAISGSAIAAQSGQPVTASDVSPMTAVMQFNGGIVEQTCQVQINGITAINATNTNLMKEGTTPGTFDVAAPVNYVPGSVVSIDLGWYTPTDALAGTYKAAPINVVLTQCPTNTVSYTVTGQTVATDNDLLVTTGVNSGVMGILIGTEAAPTVSILNSATPTVVTLTGAGANDATTGFAATGAGDFKLSAVYKNFGTGLTEASFKQGSATGFAALNFDYGL